MDVTRTAPIARRPPTVVARTAAAAGIAAMFAASALVIAGAVGGLDQLVPAAKLRYPDWLRGPLAPFELDLEPSGLAVLLLVICAAYLVVLACAQAVSARTAVATIAGLHVLYMLAPPLLSSDVFGYIDLGRLGAVHGIDPYSPDSTPLPDDEVYDFRRWGSDLPAPYGPLFIALMYPIGTLGVPAAFWALKLLVTAASLGTLLLLWRCAERLGRDPVPAALFVGLNPLLLVFCVGGAHNDTLLTLALMGGVALGLSERERWGSAALSAGVAVKVSAGLPLLFMLAGARRRVDALKGAALAALGALALTAVMFGTDARRLVDEVREQQDQVALFSFPNRLGEWLGHGGITDGIHTATRVALAAAVLYLLWRTWRGYSWIAAAGWATAALLVTSAWLLPWYLVWLLPLAALADDRRLRAAALAIGGFVVYTRVDLWFML
jgi:alpha-1,6-mannosyltransferase